MARDDEPCDHNGNAWTVETLRIHFLAILDEREKRTNMRFAAADEARELALAAQRSFLGGIVAAVGLVIAIGTLIALVVRR